YRHIPDQRRKKLDDKSETLILIGYHTAGSYKLYNPLTKKVVASRDVIVNEKDHWNWQTDNASPNSTLPFTFADDEVTEPTPPVVITPTPTNIAAVNVRRSDRPRAPIPDNLITNDGDLVHLALFVDIEPLSYATAAKS
ncbi:copia-type polyprotein, partial [Trifolium medium]|nr:copia-type polyprotein [Trifolium medium]